jgi:hypothetical protein
MDDEKQEMTPDLMTDQLCFLQDEVKPDEVLQSSMAWPVETEQRCQSDLIANKEKMIRKLCYMTMRSHRLIYIFVS